MPLSDADILLRVQRGEHELFGQLVSRYASRLLRVAESKLGERAAAEDIVQEAFLAAFSARSSYNPQFAVSTWLWTILLNLCRTRGRRHRRRPWEQAAGSWDSTSVDIPGAAGNPLARLIAEEESALLHRLLEEIPESQADALRLRFFGGLKYEEMAQAMECSVSGAKRRVKSGLLKLSERLQSFEQPAHGSGHPREDHS